jgi:xanthine dehydrogenase accessory factor
MMTPMANRDQRWEAFDDYVLDFALDRIRAGEKIALVTLAKIEGSSPRPLGAQMAVSETGRWVGYLSGGCIERAVVSEAVSAIAEGRNRTVRYGRGSKYMDIQLPCGSAIELVFDVGVSVEELAAVDARLQQRLPATLRVPSFGEGTDACLVRHYQPRKRLIVAGVGPSAVQLSRLGQAVGFDVVAYSPDRPTIEAASQLGAETISIAGAGDPPRIRADARTAIVFMFHDHEWEKELLPAALATDAFYIGAVGSRATHRMRLRRLVEMGFDPAQLERIHGPAGLFVGVKNATDIALSILAEIAQIQRTIEQLHLGCEALSDLDDHPFKLSEDVGSTEAGLSAG